MYRVLLPIDDDEDRVDAQVQTVLELPGPRNGVEVTLLHVIDDERASIPKPTQIAAGQHAEERLTAAGVRTLERGETGDPARAIIESARDLGADLIVLGGRKRSPLGALVFGSVSNRVVRDARRPVTITGPIDHLERPSHRCVTCGETYYTSRETGISTCRRCGGIHVERVRDDALEANA
ncbi:universal stress protein [Natronobiforma cellulositropha]|uniref:universal stress protein n=1 Tax=Natronobiforma cellulositropha TaxID=1679076 RepID=UPI0021D56F50|nr:universal stress protein [Natronobiforma cellulositropha]